MKQEFLDMLYIYSCGIWDKTPKLKEKISKDVLLYAVQQGVLPFVYLGIEKLGNAKFDYISEELYNSVKQGTMKSIGNNIRRLEISHRLIEELEENGLKNCVLKGEALAHLYLNTTCRISGDVDMLIDKKDIEQISGILKKQGFTVMPLFPTAHHLVAEHPVAGEFELHFQLYDVYMKSLFAEYGETREDFMDVVVDGYKIKTLGVNDGLLFTYLHYVKHFLSGGTGVKPLADLLFYIRKYKEEINWAEFKNIIKSLQYDKLFDVSLTIGVNYLGFEAEDLVDFNKEDALAEKVLEDIRCGGNFGKFDEERKNFAYVVMSRKGKTTLDKSEKRRVIRMVFPKKETLKKRYPKLKLGIFFYPVAWVKRIVEFLKKEEKQDKVKNMVSPYKTLELTDAIEERLKLIKELEIIDKAE